MRWSVVALACLLAAAAPASAAGTVLYMHVLDGQDLPISPQAPADGYVANDSFGAATSSLSCLPPVPTVGLLGADYHTVYAYATPSLIEYSRGSGQPELHPARGLRDSVPLEGAAPVLHWYWSTEVAAGQGPVPTPVPNVVVQATMRAGAAISIDDVAYNTGEVLAEGRSEPSTLAGDASTGVEHSLVDGHHVYHFTIPLEVKGTAIPKEGYNLRIDTYVVRDGCPGEGYFTPNLLSMHSSSGHRPRLELATVQAPRVEVLAPRLENGSWVFDLRAHSPWGGLDVGDVAVEVLGPTAATTIAAGPYHAATHCHCDVFGAYAEHSTDVRAVWDAAADEAEPGLYTLRVQAQNLQGTANVTAEQPFAVASEKESPGFAPGLAVLAVLGLALLLRRRV
jgi:PGF-CTERM protein